MIDQFIASAESKWGQPSGLVMLLPHGQEGGGPEHSSARLERFLQLCAENNMQVVNCTTPAQYFHLLRRQMRGGPDRARLAQTSDRDVAQEPAAASASDLDCGRSRQGRLSIPCWTIRSVTESREPSARFCCAAAKSITKCWPRAKRARARDETALRTAIVRIEQLYPFPEAEIRAVIAALSTPRSGVVWVQEEPRNMGAWIFMRTRLQPIMANEARTLGYAGRPGERIHRARFAPKCTSANKPIAGSSLRRAHRRPSAASGWFAERKNASAFR